MPQVSRGKRPILLAFLFVAGGTVSGPSWSQSNSKAKHDHPVIPGFERFFAHSKTELAAGGRLLLGELGCLSCHRPADEKAFVVAPRKAPNLDGVAGRVKASYLRKFLSDPHVVKPGTTMPSLFAGVS